MIIAPPEPSGEQCGALSLIEWDGRKGYACWYPQMGGYVGKCVIEPEDNGCFDAWVWHDGEFPFGDRKRPAQIHHCDAEQFITFGRFAQSLDKT